MIKINLLPHREARRQQNKAAFFRLLILAGVFGSVIVLIVGLFIGAKNSEQDQRNAFIKAENAKLDDQIKEIASIKQEIEALKARQQAVEDLQSDRNQPVYLLDELVKQVPEGIFLRGFKQEGQKVSMTGVAQSNERVSELLRNLGNNSLWLERPELIEIKAGTVGQGKDTKKIFEFTINVGIKRQRDKDMDKDKPAAAAGIAAVGNKAMPVDLAAAGKAASDAGGRGAAANAPKKP
jgi:type IV pilus assembly protein PilN